MKTIDFIHRSATQAAQDINENFSNIGQGGGSSAKHLNILVLGNSYSCDAWSYVPFILKEMGITCSIGIYYVAGQPISLMVNNYSTPFTGSVQRGMFYIDTRTHTAWQTVIGQNDDLCTHLCVVYNDTPWDIIAVQQSHTTCAEASNYSSVGKLLELILADMDKPFLFGWSVNHVHAGQSDAYYEATLDNIHNVCDFYPIDIVFPCGTAIMDGQLNSTLNVYASNLLNGDGVHLNEGLPCYIAALANVEALLRKYYPYLSVLGDKTRPTDSWLDNKSIPDKQGSSVGFGSNDDGEENAYLAQCMAILANDNPFKRIGGTCTLFRELEHCSMGTGSVPYGTVTNLPIVPESGYTIQSAMWRRDSENEWHTSNFVNTVNANWYIQICVTEDIHIKATAAQ